MNIQQEQITFNTPTRNISC